MGIFESIIKQRDPSKPAAGGGIFADIIEKRKGPADGFQSLGPVVGEFTEPRSGVKIDPIAAAKDLPGALLAGTERAIGTAVGGGIEFAGRQAEDIGIGGQVGQAFSIGIHPLVGRIIAPLVNRFTPKALTKLYDARNRKLTSIGEKVKGFMEEQASTGWEAADPEIMEQKWANPIQYATRVTGESAPSFIGAVGAGIVTKSPQMSLIVLGSLEKLDSFDAQINRGASFKKADIISSLSGAWEAATEKIPLDFILKGKARNRLVKALIAGPLEGVQEVIAGMGQNFLEHLGYNTKDIEAGEVPAAVWDATQHIFDNWLESAVAGTALGGIAGGLLGNVNAPGDAEQAVAEQLTRQDPSVEPDEARQRAREHIAAQVEHERDLYDQLLQKHFEGDTKATEDLNALQQRFHLPTFEALLERIAEGEQRYSEYIQAGMVGRGPVKGKAGLPLVLPTGEEAAQPLKFNLPARRVGRPTAEGPDALELPGTPGFPAATGAEARAAAEQRQGQAIRDRAVEAANRTKINAEVEKWKEANAGRNRSALAGDMQRLLATAESEKDVAELGRLADQMAQLDRQIDELELRNLRELDVKALRRLTNQQGINVPKGATKSGLIRLLQGPADVVETEGGFVARTLLAETEAGRAWTEKAFPTYNEAVEAVVQDRIAVKGQEIVAPGVERKKTGEITVEVERHERFDEMLAALITHQRAGQQQREAGRQIAQEPRIEQQAPQRPAPSEPAAPAAEDAPVPSVEGKVEIDGIDVKPAPIKENELVLIKGFNAPDQEATDKNLPRIKDGYIRLYRGQSRIAREGAGQWFTPFLGHAHSYAEEQGKNWEVTYIDLPKNIANKYNATLINKEFLGLTNVAKEYQFPQLKQGPIPTDVPKRPAPGEPAPQQPTPKPQAGANLLAQIPAQTIETAKGLAERSGKNVFIRKGEARGWFTRTVPPKEGDFFTVRPTGQVVFGHAPEAPSKKPGKGPRMMSGFDPGLDKFIAEEGKAGVKKVVEAVKVAGRVAKATKDLAGSILEPSRQLQKKFGPDPFVSVVKAIHRPEAKALEFEEQRIESLDSNVAELRNFFASFDSETQFNFMKAYAGKADSPEAAKIQREARAKLPDELKDPNIERAVREISAANWKRLLEVSEGQTPWVADYFYGTWKEADLVDKFLGDHIKSTKRFLKHKSILSVADGINHGLTPRYTNYIDNLAAESRAIARLESMKWLRADLMSTGKGVYIDEFADVMPEAGWKDIKDPVFRGLWAAPELAETINKLISANKVTRQPALNALRKTNNLIRIVKFIGGIFHARVIVKATLADSGYLGFMHKKSAFRWLTLARQRTWEAIQKTPQYRRLLELGLGHKFSIEQDAQEQFKGFTDKLTNGNYPGATLGGVKQIIRLPANFTEWMFNQWIPMVKYNKVLDAWAELEVKQGRPATDLEIINIIKEAQNFYGEMNERLFGRSGTATTTLRFFFLAPGFAEGNYRTILKAITQWGVGDGWNAARSRANILNSGLITAITATIGTMILTGKPPKRPEKKEDIRDLFKIDTGKKDSRGRKVMIDMMDYDKDYFNIFYNLFTGRPDKAITESIRRLGGMKAPLLDIAADGLQVAMGRAIYDWKGDRVVEVTDTLGEKMLKVAHHEISKLEPIPVSVFRSVRQRQANDIVSFLEGVSGFRPTLTERDKREAQTLRLCWSLKGQQEETFQSLAAIERPREAVQWYNDRVEDVLEGPLVPEAVRTKWTASLTIDLDRYLQNKAFAASHLAGSEEQQGKADKAVAILKNFDIGPSEATDLLKQYYARPGTTTPRSPLESDRVLGRSRKRRRLAERLSGE